MKVESLAIPAMNNFASLYIDQKEPVKDFFHYNITENSVFENRYQDLMKRTYARSSVAHCIEQYMSKFPQSKQTQISLEKLKDDSSVVVIGGQQAGLLTGPLYTIHKIISIIKLAEEQEKKLEKPIIPIFWIAGEDHDFLEINHVFVEVKKNMKKIQFTSAVAEKRMASDIKIESDRLQAWISEVFALLGENEFTKSNLTLLHNAVMNSETVTQFFAYIIASFFKEYGLLLIDSADPALRKIEIPFFSTLIEQNVHINEAVLRQQNLIEEHGFNRVMDIEKNAANLFFYLDQERNLLQYERETETFLSEKIDFHVQKSELLQMLENQPEIFSNNVVTRPLMQEWLFPSLAFIAGPGEIAYWGELKQAFESLAMKMPPIIPRLNITFLPASIERDMKELGVSIDQVLINGVGDSKSQYIESVSDPELDMMLIEMKKMIEKQYGQIIERIGHIDRGLIQLSKKNLSIHLHQIDFLKEKTDHSLYLAHEALIEKYDRIERHLKPDGSLQERIWNIFYYLNRYGVQFIDQLMALEYQFDGTHKVIKI